MLRSLVLAAIVAAAPAPAVAATIFVTELTGPAEEPPNASPGTGSATVVFDPIAHSMRVITSFEGLIATSTAAHIHVLNTPNDPDPTDTVGPVATQVPTFIGFPLGVTSGFYDQVFDLTQASTYNPAFITAFGGSIPTAEAALFAGLNEGRAYFNIHSTEFPAGEIRGFLEVPEPATVAIMLFGLTLGIGLRQRRA